MIKGDNLSVKVVLQGPHRCQDGCSFMLAGKLECKGNSRCTVKHDIEEKTPDKHVLEGKKFAILDYWSPKAPGSCYYALMGSPFPSKSCLPVRSSMKAEPSG